MTTDYTTLKELFTINHPTIILWDKKYFSIRGSAIKLYNQLEKAGILFFSPKDCANFLNQNNNNYMDWWLSERVQKTKNDYCNNFCKFTRNLPQEINKILN